MTDAGIDREAHERLCGIVRREGKERWSARFPDDPQAVALREKEAEGELAAIGRVGMSRAFLTAIAIRDAAGARGIPTSAWLHSVRSPVLDAVGLNPVDPTAEELWWELDYSGRSMRHLEIGVGCKRASSFARHLGDAEETRSFLTMDMLRLQGDIHFQVPVRREPPGFRETGNRSYQHTVLVAWDPLLARIAELQGGRLPRLDDPVMNDPGFLSYLTWGWLKRSRLLADFRKRDLFHRVKPRSAADVAAVFALSFYRKQDLTKLVNRYTDPGERPGARPPEYLDGLLAGTRGMMLYREQSYRALRHVGVTTYAEWREIWRNLAIGLRRLPTYRKLFDAGRARGLPDDEVHRIVEAFEEYAPRAITKAYCTRSAWMVLAEEMGSVRT